MIFCLLISSGSNSEAYYICLKITPKIKKFSYAKYFVQPFLTSYSYCSLVENCPKLLYLRSSPICHFCLLYFSTVHKPKHTICLAPVQRTFNHVTYQKVFWILSLPSSCYLLAARVRRREIEFPGEETTLNHFHTASPTPEQLCCLAGGPGQGAEVK